MSLGFGEPEFGSLAFWLVFLGSEGGLLGMDIETALLSSTLIASRIAVRQKKTTRGPHCGLMLYASEIQFPNIVSKRSRTGFKIFIHVQGM